MEIEREIEIEKEKEIEKEVEKKDISTYNRRGVGCVDSWID